MADQTEQDVPHKKQIQTSTTNTSNSDVENLMEAVESSQSKESLKKRILGIVWDSLDKSPEERKFIAKVDTWILTCVCIAYFVKYLDQTNVRMISSISRKNPWTNTLIRLSTHTSRG